MPLSRLTSLFSEVSHTEPETVADRDGWLFAQRCEARWSTGGPAVTLLLVYRSVILKDTKALFQPVADLMLGARCMEVLGQGTMLDPAMMFGKAQYMVARLTNLPSMPEGPFTLEELRSLIQLSVESTLSDTLVPA